MIELFRGDEMPSTITHTFIGLDTINKLDNKPKKIINDHLDNYKVYCQNMDILYFYHIFLLKNNKIKELGHRFHHEHVFESFNTLIMDNKQNKDDELFTFIAALITHYQADTTIHPYINSFTDYHNETKRFNKHFEIETYIDNYYIKNRLNSNHKKYNCTNDIFNYTEKDIIKKELDNLYKKIFNYPNMGKKYYRALKEMKFTYNYVRYDKYGIKKILYKIIDINPFTHIIPRVTYLSYHFDLDNDTYYLNLNHQKWANPHNKKYVSNKSFLDLYEDTINNSSNIINKLYQYIYEDKDINIEKLIKNLDYGNGLPICPDK